MDIGNEITVLVLSDYDTLKKTLIKKGFVERGTYDINDYYMINKNIDLTKLSNLEILKKCVIVREMNDEIKELLYKYKKTGKKGVILEQGKVECPITDINKAINFMEYIGFQEFFKIHDKSITFTNDRTELTVQVVNEKYIFIEMEENCKYINRTYKDIEELKEDINKYDLPIDNSNYFVKKAELIIAQIQDCINN